MKFCRVSHVFLCICACIHDELMQVPEVYQETSKAAMFSDVW